MKYFRKKVYNVALHGTHVWDQCVQMLAYTILREGGSEKGCGLYKCENVNHYG